MSAVGYCAEGAVTWEVSYRHTFGCRVGGRRFEVGFLHYVKGAGAAGLSCTVYYCQNDADAVALEAFKEAEADELRSWCRARGFLDCSREYRVQVDPLRWEALVYPRSEAAAQLGAPWLEVTA